MGPEQTDIIRKRYSHLFYVLLQLKKAKGSFPPGGLISVHIFVPVGISVRLSLLSAPQPAGMTCYLPGMGE